MPHILDKIIKNNLFLNYYIPDMQKTKILLRLAFEIIISFFFNKKTMLMIKKIYFC